METRLESLGGTLLLLPQPILEAIFGFIFSSKVLCMKCVTKFVSGIKREGEGRFYSEALGGDPAGVSRRNSAAVATTNLESIFLVHCQQNGLFHEKSCHKNQKKCT